MPTWGGFVIAVAIVYVAVLVSSRSARGGSHTPHDLHPASTWRHLDDAARDEVTCLLDRGRTIEAIKILVARDGIGVRHAKATVEYGRLQARPVPAGIRSCGDTSPIEGRLRDLESEGKTVAAITLLRDSTGMTLREAKDAVDQL
nr:hypothetical protein [Rhodococcus wratislaviensis]GLK36386.1 hypothetical protein GCM10017611_32430 [Rhodococcus wratislaviensis]